MLIPEFEKVVRRLDQQVALRYYYYRLSGMNKNAIALPSLKKEAKLPVILNQQELKGLLAAPTLLKQRVALICPD